MEIAPFDLERWFAEHEHTADIMLAESGIRPLPASRFSIESGALGYVIPTNGDPALRAQIGSRYNRSAEELLATSGTQEANFLVFTSLLDGGDHVVVVTPTYQSLSAIPEALASVTRVWLEPPTWTLDPDAIAEAIQSNTRLVVLANPNNPTGRYHSWETITACYELAVDAGAYLVCDEAYRLLAEDPLPPVATLDRGISTTSVTKAHGLAGARFGWIAGPRTVINAAWHWKDYTTISPSIMGQAVAAQALADEAAILECNRQLAKQNRELVASFVDTHRLEWAEPVGVIGFVSLPDGFSDSRAFCQRFVEEERVVLAPGTMFGYDGYFRIGFGLPTPELREGLGRLESFINRHAA